MHDVTNDDLKKSALFYGEIIEIRNEITIQIILKRKLVVQYVKRRDPKRKRKKEKRNIAEQFFVGV